MIEHIIGSITGFLWTYPVVILCVAAGIFFTVRLRFVQVKGFKHAIELVSGKYDNPNEEGHITHFQALSAALSGTIGIGNMAGVAIAIALGGPGAVFWMWLIAFIGMATKYAECALGTIYRGKDPVTGDVRGGPMYYITQGLGEKWKPMAAFYAFCMAVGAMGVGGMFQSNQAASVIEHQFGIGMPVTGLILAFLLALVIIGGIKRIGTVASKIVPTMCVTYVLLSLYVCVTHFTEVPAIIQLILTDAFTGTAVVGGAVGEVIRMGIRRAVFSNEAGLGSASVAHAAVKTDYPIREGIVASLGPLIDTIIVCTATAMVIISSGHFGYGRFQPIAEGIQFENKPAIEMRLNNWHVTDAHLPKAKNPFEHYQTGSQALTFKGNMSTESKSPLYKIRYAEDKTPSGVRFSVYYEGGKQAVQFLDQQGRSMGIYSLNKNSEGLEGTPKEAEWHYRYLPLAKGATQPAAIRFIANGTGNLFIDRIDAVENLGGINLTAASFDYFFPGYGFLFIAISAVFFAFSTLITWSYYGETAATYLFGRKVIMPYKWVFIVFAIVGTFFGLNLLVDISDMLVGFMVIPNAIAIIALSGVVSRETKVYFEKLKLGEFKTYK